MSKYLMARVIEGTDTWYSYGFKQGTGNFSFSEIHNKDLAIVASCNQDGFDRLYNIGKTLWDGGMCTKFEIAAFDRDNLFWKSRPDNRNFAQNEYDGWFDSMIDEEFRAYSHEDFQNDKFEMDYITEYQNKFWPDKLLSSAYGPDCFNLILNDTKLHDDLMMVQKWIDNKGAIPTVCGFECRGQLILNPFYDETLRFPVEPVSYYGTKNIENYLGKIKKHIAKESQKHMPLADKISAAEQQKNIHTSDHKEPTSSLSRE